MIGLCVINPSQFKIGVSNTGNVIVTPTAISATPIARFAHFNCRNNSPKTLNVVVDDGNTAAQVATKMIAALSAVRPFPNTKQALHQVSTEGGRSPRWSHDGREIFYESAARDLVRVAVTPGNAFAVTDPRVLFPLRGVEDWDVAPDGQRFAVIRDRATQEHSKLVVVENFADELRAKVPK